MLTSKQEQAARLLLYMHTCYAQLQLTIHAHLCEVLLPCLSTLLFSWSSMKLEGPPKVPLFAAPVLIQVVRSVLE